MNNNNFKVGDQVIRTEKSFSLLVGQAYTVQKVASNRDIKINGGWYPPKYFKAAPINVERAELEKAIEVFEKHDIRKHTTCETSYYVGAGYDAKSKVELLDKLFPAETAQQKEIKDIEEQMRELAASTLTQHNKLADRLAAVKEDF